MNACRVCSKHDFSSVINLHSQPLGNIFLHKEQIGKEDFYPLHVLFCNNCYTAQLDYTVKKEVIYTDHTYLSGVTRSLDTHFKHIAEEIDQRFFSDKQKKRVLDIGSNDGTQLKHFKSLGYEVVGVEAAKRISDIANVNGIYTIPAFFNSSLLPQLGGSFDVINAAGVLFHLEELHSVIEGIRLSLQKGGVFVAQCLYMKSIMENGAFDQIYHEHLLYYTVKTLDTLLQLHGLELFDAYISPIHGGSIIGFATHVRHRSRTSRLTALLHEEELQGINTKEAYQKLAKRAQNMKGNNLAFLHEKKTEGKKIFGLGAPVKGNTLLNYFQINTTLLDCLVEKNPLRKGMYSPGMHLPIVLEKELIAPPDVYYVLAWNFKKEILENNQSLIKQGVEFYFPIDPFHN